MLQEFRQHTRHGVLHALNVVDDGRKQRAGGVLCEKSRRAPQDRVVKIVAQVGDHAEAGVVRQVGASIVEYPLQDGCRYQRERYHRPRILKVRGNQLLKVENAVGAGESEKLNRPGLGARVEYAIENRANQKKPESIQQAHDRHQHNRCEQLPPVREDITQQARQWAH